MIVVSKKEIFDTLKIILVFILVMLIGVSLGILEAWVFHKYFPDIADDPYFWMNYSETFAPSKQGYSIEIDLDRLQLTLYKDGSVEQTYPVSGGKDSTPTPTGLWTVSDLGDGGGFGANWIALDCPWGQYGIHATLEPWLVGRKNSSHGCIEIKSSDIENLKSHISLGTPVFIKHDRQPFRNIKEGDSGNDVLHVQDMLGQLGYLNKMPDGIFGYETSAAVANFQKNTGLRANGAINRNTYDLIAAKFG